MGMCLFIHTVISSCSAAPGTRRDTLPEPPQPALRRAAQALRVMVLPVSCLLFLPRPALDLPPEPHFSREAETRGLGVLHPGTSGLHPAPVDRGSWAEGRMSWKSLQPVSRVPQDPSRAGVKPCLEGPGGADHAGQQGRGLPAPALPRVPGCHGSRGSSPLPVPGSTSALLPVSFQKPTSLTDK